MIRSWHFGVYGKRALCGRVEYQVTNRWYRVTCKKCKARRMSRGNYEKKLKPVSNPITFNAENYVEFLAQRKKR